MAFQSRAAATSFTFVPAIERDGKWGKYIAAQIVDSNDAVTVMISHKALGKLSAAARESLESALCDLADFAAKFSPATPESAEAKVLRERAEKAERELAEMVERWQTMQRQAPPRGTARPQPVAISHNGPATDDDVSAALDALK